MMPQATTAIYGKPRETTEIFGKFPQSGTTLAPGERRSLKT